MNELPDLFDFFWVGFVLQTLESFDDLEPSVFGGETSSSFKERENEGVDEKVARNVCKIL